MSQQIHARNVTLFIGSPRKNSNTHILAQEAERALCERGVTTKIVFLPNLTIRDCQNCRGCKQVDHETCVIDDDMQPVYTMIQESAGIIVAAPVYFGYVPSVTKAWLDRLVPFIGMNMQPKIGGSKQVSFIFTQNMPDPAMFMPSLRSFIEGVAMTGLIVRDCLVAPDCERGQKPMADERPDLMDRAFVVGRDLLD